MFEGRIRVQLRPRSAPVQRERKVAVLTVDKKGAIAKGGKKLCIIFEGDKRGALLRISEKKRGGGHESRS